MGLDYLFKTVCRTTAWRQEVVERHRKLKPRDAAFARTRTANSTLLHTFHFRHPWRSDEAEAAAEGAIATADEDAVVVSSHRRRRGARKPLPERLPRIEVVHELPELDRRCEHDGRLLVEIGEVVSEQLDIVPATIRVLRHIRKQYACDCGQCIKTAPLPAVNVKVVVA